MQVIPDANPLISLLIAPGNPIQLLFLDELELVAPALLFEEIERNKDIILRYSGLDENEVDMFIGLLKKRIRIIPEHEFILFREKAEKICPDKKDITYFALALHLRCPLWSNEKRLREQKYILTYATHELMELFRISKV